MTHLLTLFAARPWAVLVFLTLVSLLAASQLPHLRVQVSADELQIRDDPNRAYYKKIAAQFGDEKAVLLVLQDKALLEPEKLKLLKQVVASLEALPFVKTTQSLFSLPWLKTVDGYLNKDAYLKALPSTDMEANERLVAAANNPFVRKVLLSADRQTMAIAIILADVSIEDSVLSQQIDAQTAVLSAHYQNVFTVGLPYVRTEIANSIHAEQGKLAPLAVAALLIALFVLLRQLLDVLIPIFTASLSILWTLAGMAWMDIPLNVVTSIVPILLIIVGSTEDIHLLSEFRHGQRQGLDNQQALHRMSKKMGRIIFLTFITTYLGFLSISLSKIDVLWQFGVVASTGLLVNFLVTIALIPALLALAGRWQLDGGALINNPAVNTWAERYWRRLQRHRWKIVSLAMVGVLVAGMGIPLVKVNHSAMDALSEDSNIRKHIGLVNQQLSGLESFSIVLDSGIEGTFLKVRYLDELSKLQGYIEAQGWSGSTASFANYLALLNAAFDELDAPAMPDSDSVVNELMIFLSYDHVSRYVSSDYSTARIVVRHGLDSSADLQSVITNLQTFIDTHTDKGLRVRLTGDSILSLSATEAMVYGQLQSIALVALIIVVIIAVMFLDIRTGLLAALPNIFPVVVLFGFMGYAGIPLNIGTAMAAAIAIGIAVDDTLHFMLRYNLELKSSKSEFLALHRTIHNEALPVLATSIALMAGFLVFSFSTFTPIALFGQLSALVIASALLADFVITPIVVSTLRLVTVWDMLSLHVRNEVLGNSILFHGMKDWQIRQFILSSTVINYPAQTAIFCRGDDSQEMYLVLSGTVEVRFPGRDSQHGVVECFSVGESFGDVALLAKETRRTDAVALEHCELLVLSAEGLRVATRRNPLIAARLFINISKDIACRLVSYVEKQHGQPDKVEPTLESQDPLKSNSDDK